MKRLALLFAAFIVLGVATPASAHHRTRVEVMSQNLYIGADLNRLLLGESPAALLHTVEQTDYPSRAVEIAEAIDDFNPDLLGLQEVTKLTQFTAIPGTLCEPDPTKPPEVVDYLDILMEKIAAENENYHVGPAVENANVTLPVTFDPDYGFPVTCAQVIDRDVIIYRNGVTVSHPRWGNFATNFTVELGGFPIEFTRGYTMVDAVVGSQEFTFVNTHLEVAGAPCLTAAGPVICQDVQADELAEVLAGKSGSMVLVGDINAEPGMKAYETFADGGYVDTWLERFPYNDESGNTCCQVELLNNEESQLTERIDHIFIRELEPTFVVTTVVGDWDQRKTPDGLWYSDHGGPWARLYLPNS